MKNIKTYEEYTEVEYTSSKKEHPSYKNEDDKRKRKKIKNIVTLPNSVKNILLFKRNG